MPDAYPRERLQPSLLDRLADEVKSLEREIERVWRALLPELDEARREALASLLAPERQGPPDNAELARFSGLEPGVEALVRQLVDLEGRRQHELKTRFVLSPERLRACVLRDLAWLFNTRNLSQHALRAGDPAGRADALDPHACPHAAASVVNYGIPALAGRTSPDPELVADELREAIRRFEPRLRARTVKVQPVAEAQAGHALAFDVEAELLSEPAALRLLMRTLIDLEDGAVTIRAHGSG
jgi:type VI secretion system protein ImpF